MEKKQFHPSNWRSFPHIVVNLSYWPMVLQIVDLFEGVVLINDHHAHGANIIGIRQTSSMSRQ